MHTYICMHTYIHSGGNHQQKKKMPERSEKYIYIYIYTYIYKLGATHALDECTSGGNARKKKAGKKKAFLSAPSGNHL